MNGYLTIGSVIVAGALGGYFGDSYGTNRQAVKDQVRFDKINGDLEKQKTEANTLFRTLTKEKLALVEANGKLIHDLEKAREDNRKASAELTRKYDGLSLRYGAAQTAGHRNCGGGAQNEVGEAVPAAAPVEVLQLPDPITRNLRQLAATADEWLDWYRTAWGYVEQMKCSNE